MHTYYSHLYKFACNGKPSPTPVYSYLLQRSDRAVAGRNCSIANDTCLPYADVAACKKLVAVHFAEYGSLRPWLTRPSCSGLYHWIGLGEWIRARVNILPYGAWGGEGFADASNSRRSEPPWLLRAATNRICRCCCCHYDRCSRRIELHGRVRRGLTTPVWSSDPVAPAPLPRRPNHRPDRLWVGCVWLFKWRDGWGECGIARWSCLKL